MLQDTPLHVHQIGSQAIAVPHLLLLSMNPCLGRSKENCRPRSEGFTGCLCEPMLTLGTGKYKTVCPARIAALKRNLTSESAHWSGEYSDSVFSDFSKIFDSFDIPAPLPEAVKTSFPLSVLSCLLQPHLAPRVIQANGFCSESSQVSRSILAVCRSSVALARFHATHISQVSAIQCQRFCRRRVHALQQSGSRLFGGVLDKLVPAADMLGHEAKLLKLTLS